jgi:hypothetical protein
MTPKFIEHIHLDIPKNLTPKVDEIGDLVCNISNKMYVQQVEKIDNELCKQIRDIAVANGIDDIYLLDKNEIISALEKQIPKKPLIPWDSMTGTYYCPNCIEGIIFDRKNYCCDCGQALDWSDTE